MASPLLHNSLRLNYLHVDKYVFPSVWVYPNNRVPYSMLRLIQNGRALFIIDGETIHVRKNQIIYIPQGCDMYCRALDDDFTFISIRFTAAIPLNDTEIWSESFGIKKITECTDEKIHSYFEQMVFARTSQSKGKSFRLRGYLELIMAYLIDVNTGTLGDKSLKTSEENYSEALLKRDTPVQIKRRNMSPALKMDARIQTVIEYIITHPNQHVNIKEMCKMVDISKSSLRRLFKEHTGKSPTEFIKELHMAYAARKLLETDERISSIAYELGYNDPNYFSRIFKSNFGISPQQYRRISRE